MARDTSFFTTIKEQVDLEDYLTKQLGVELLPDGGGRLKAICPFHEEDSPSFKVMDSGDGSWKRWHCFGACGEGGTVIDAAMKHEGFGLAHEAARMLNDLYGLGLEIDSEAYKAFARTISETREDIERTREAINDTESKTAEAARNYLHRRGFTDETIENFQLGVDTSKTKAGRLSIPLVDKANHPVSVANRALFDDFPCRACGERVTVKEVVKQRFQVEKAITKGEESDPNAWKKCPRCQAPDSQAKVSWLATQHPKYLYLRDFDKANFLYNQNSSRRVLHKDETVAGLFLVEGYADVWAGWQAGHKAICAYNGSQLSDWQAGEVVELASRARKPIILVPDFDAAGRSGVYTNIEKLRALREDVEIQVVYGIDRLTYEEDGETRRCKDLGDVLKHFGEGQLTDILDNNRWQAAEWQIRQIVEAVNPRTGQPYDSVAEQQRLCAEILSTERSKVALDHLIDYLVEKWDRKEDLIRSWFYANLSPDNATSYQHLFKTIDQAREEAREFLRDDNIIKIGFDELDECMPGGGFRPGQLSMFLGKSGTGKTMLVTQILANMANNGVRSIIFTLEQAAKSLYPRLACQVLDITPEEANELIARDDEEAEEKLRPVQEIFKNLLIIDNVPGEGAITMESITPGRIQAMIQEANLTHFKDVPATVVAIDHLGILRVDDDAPREIKGSENMRPGYIMERLFAICKQTNVFMMVLQQLPKEIPPGVPFGYDSGRGGSQQTDFCDAIFQIWRPETQQDLDEAERAQYEGQYKLAIGKNRFGPTRVGHYRFDKSSLQILPVLKFAQPDHQNPDGVIETDEGVKISAEGVEGEISAPSTDDQASAAKAAPVPVKEASEGATAEGLAALTESSPDPVPADTAALLDVIGGGEEDPEQLGDPELRKWFES